MSYSRVNNLLPTVDTDPWKYTCGPMRILCDFIEEAKMKPDGTRSGKGSGALCFCCVVPTAVAVLLGGFGLFVDLARAAKRTRAATESKVMEEHVQEPKYQTMTG